MTIQKEPQDKFLRMITWILLVLCMMVLVRYILFKGGVDNFKMYMSHYDSRKMVKTGIKRANFTPFASLKYFYSVRKRYTYVAKNILGNIIGFIPLGVLFPILMSGRWKGWKTIGLVFLISLAFETIQLMTDLGVFDVDDLLLNTVGGAIGYLLYTGSKKLMFMNDPHPV
jgi:glycopeptide antibiotics resistance protein